MSKLSALALALTLAPALTIAAMVAPLPALATDSPGQATPGTAAPASPPPHPPAQAPRRPAARAQRQAFFGHWEGQAVVSGETCRIAVDARTITAGCRDPEGTWHMAEFNSGTCPQLTVRIEGPSGETLRHDLTEQSDGPVPAELTTVLDTLAPGSAYPTLDLWCPYQDGGVTITLADRDTLLGFVFHGAGRLHDIVRYARQP